MSDELHVIAFDHLVLRVADVKRSLAWYTDVLGLDGVRIDEWLQGQAPFPSLRISETAIIDLVPVAPGVPVATGPARNLDHLCLVVERTDLDRLSAELDLRVVDGPAERFGAQGMGRSLYVLDPDDNVVELRHY